MTTSTMEALYKLEMLPVTLNLYEFIGETKATVSKKLILFRLWNWFVLCVALAYIGVNFLYVEADHYVRTLQSLFYLSQPLLKYIVLVKQKSTIQWMLGNILTTSWNYRCFGERITAKTERVYKIVRYTQLSMLVGTVLNVHVCLAGPLFFSTDGLPIESYIPQSVVMATLVLCSQLYSFWLAVVTVIGYDFIYVSSCIHVILQLKLVKLRMRQALNTFNESSASIFHRCIKHHQFLLSMFFCMKDLYSILLLFHYLTTLVTICTVILELFLRQLDATSYVVNTLAITFLLLQFGLYTFSAEQVTTEFSDISTAIYTSKWYRNDMKTQKLVLYVIMKSQERLYFTGAGLVDINAEAFESVVRKSFSFGAIVRNVLKL